MKYGIYNICKVYDKNSIKNWWKKVKVYIVTSLYSMWKGIIALEDKL